MKNYRGIGLLILFLFLGMFIGGVLGQVLAPVFAKYFPVLNESIVIGVPKPVNISLGVLQLVLGVTLRLNFAGLLGLLIALFLFRLM